MTRAGRAHAAEAPGWSWVSLLSEGRGWPLGHPPCTFSFFRTKGNTLSTPCGPPLPSALLVELTAPQLQLMGVEAGLQAVTGNWSGGRLEDRQPREGGSFSQ